MELILSSLEISVTNTIKSIHKHFSGLPDKQLYPSVSAVYGNTEVRIYPLIGRVKRYLAFVSFQVSMVYLGPPLDG